MKRIIIKLGEAGSVFTNDKWLLTIGEPSEERLESLYLILRTLVKAFNDETHKVGECNCLKDNIHELEDPKD